MQRPFLTILPFQRFPPPVQPKGIRAAVPINSSQEGRGRKIVMKMKRFSL
jgi:hypothetical protein